MRYLEDLIVRELQKYLTRYYGCGKAEEIVGIMKDFFDSPEAGIINSVDCMANKLTLLRYLMQSNCQYPFTVMDMLDPYYKLAITLDRNYKLAAALNDDSQYPILPAEEINQAEIIQAVSLVTDQPVTKVEFLPYGALPEFSAPDHLIAKSIFSQAVFDEIYKDTLVNLQASLGEDKGNQVFGGSLSAIIYAINPHLYAVFGETEYWLSLEEDLDILLDGFMLASVANMDGLIEKLKPLMAIGHKYLILGLKTDDPSIVLVICK